MCVMCDRMVCVCVMCDRVVCYEHIYHTAQWSATKVRCVAEVCKCAMCDRCHMTHMHQSVTYLSTTHVIHITINTSLTHYGVATISRHLKIIGLFCRKQSLL